MDERQMRKARALPEDPKRLAIFVFYDKDGVVDDYIPRLLGDLKENLTDLVVTVNGALTPEGRRKLGRFTDRIFVRENEGFDFGAWRETMIDHLGWDELARYDELILLNDTFFGPFYPFREVFAEMDRREVDFWGLTAHSATDGFPEHIQSYFLAVRRAMHESGAFRRWWEQLPALRTVKGTSLRVEAGFTSHFSELGFAWDVLVDARDLEEGHEAENLYLDLPYELAANRRCPVLKRKCFTGDFAWTSRFTAGGQLSRCVEYIRDRTDYDVRLIFQDVARIYPPGQLWSTLKLSFVLPEQSAVSARACTPRTAALVLDLEGAGAARRAQPYLAALPEWVDVMAVTREDESGVRERLGPLLGERLRVLAPDGEADTLPCAVPAVVKPYLEAYEFAGFCPCGGDAACARYASEALDIQEDMLENVLAGGAYVENLLGLFEARPELGVLAAPAPFYGGGFRAFASEGFFPVGGAFWCRREVLDRAMDGPGLALPDAARQLGYLTGLVMTEEYAACEVTGLRSLMGETVRAAKSDCADPYAFVRRMREGRVTGALKSLAKTGAKKLFPRSLYQKLKSVKIKLTK